MLSKSFAMFLNVWYMYILSENFNKMGNWIILMPIVILIDRPRFISMCQDFVNNTSISLYITKNKYIFYAISSCKSNFVTPNTQEISQHI